MTKKPKKIDFEDISIPTEADIARGDHVLKKMLKTKPKQHKDMVGKKKPLSGKTDGPKR